MTDTMTPLQQATDAATTSHRTWSRWHAEEQTARQQAAAARTQLASVELEDPDAAFGLMATIEEADRRAVAAEALAQAAKERHSTARAEESRQRGLELRAEAGALWAQWAEHEQRTRSLLEQLAAHEGVSHELPPRHEPTRGELMMEAARALDVEAAAAVVEGGGTYLAVREGPVVNGERDVHVGFGADMENPLARHACEVHVDGLRWGPGSVLAAPHQTVTWVMRPLPADATVVVSCSASGDSFTLPPANPSAARA